MAAGEPTFETMQRERNPRLSLDWHYSLLVADWSTGAEKLWHSTKDGYSHTTEEIDALGGILNGLVEGTTITYPAVSDGSDTHHIP